MRRGNAFTLVELLAVVAIIGLLLSLLVPSLGRARELTRRAICASNQRHVAASCHAYASDNRCMLPKLHYNAAPMGKQNHPCPYFYDMPAADQFTAAYVGDFGMFYCPSYLRNNLYNERGWCRRWDPLESTCRHASLSIL